MLLGRAIVGQRYSPLSRPTVPSIGRPTSFGAAYGVALSTATISRKAYLRGISSGAAITASAGAEYSLDGGAFTSGAGTWGTTKQIRARITSSAEYETTVTATITIGGVAYAFPVTTMAEPMAAAFAHYSDEENYTNVENYTD